MVIIQALAHPGKSKTWLDIRNISTEAQLIGRVLFQAWSRWAGIKVNRLAALVDALNLTSGAKMHLGLVLETTNITILST